MNAFIKPNASKVKILAIIVLLLIFWYFFYLNNYNCNYPDNIGRYSTPGVIVKYPDNVWLDLWDKISSPCPSPLTSNQILLVYGLKILIFIISAIIIYLVSCFIAEFLLKKRQ